MLNVHAVSRRGVRLLSFGAFVLGGRIAEYPRSVRSWEDEIEWFTQSPEMDGINRETSRVSSAKFPQDTLHCILPSGSPKNDGGKHYSA